MQRKEDLVTYDFQGWPVFKKTLKEFLIYIGGIENEDGSITFNNKELLDCYPLIYTDDGMGYGVNESYIVEADKYFDEPAISIFIEPKPSPEYQQKLIDRWNEEENEILNKIN